MLLSKCLMSAGSFKQFENKKKNLESFASDYIKIEI